MPVFIAALLDAGSILLFAALGRDTHQNGTSFAGILATAWPFLAAAVLGWLICRAWRAPTAPWPSGVVIWLVTVVGGLALRGATGGGLAFTFQLVTLAFLGLVLLGHRLIASAVSKRAAPVRMD